MAQSASDLGVDTLRADALGADRKAPVPMSLNDPKYWRQRAQEARSLAALMTDPKAKRMMASITEDYERLAKITEQRAVHSLQKPSKQPRRK